MKIIFLGTNGWFDSKQGSTPCVLVKTKKYNLLLDAGFGLAKAGNYLDRGKPVFLWLGHFHLDHIIGLHALPQLGLKKITVISQIGAEKIIQRIVGHPFSANPKEYGLEIEFLEVEPGSKQKPFTFKCLELDHIDRTLGIRIEAEGKIVSYLSDTAPCENSLILAKDADVLIHECASEKEDNFVWGHTCPISAAKTAKNAQTKKLFLFHFNPALAVNQQDRDKAENEAREFFDQTVASFDGLQVEV